MGCCWVSFVRGGNSLCVSVPNLVCQPLLFEKVALCTAVPSVDLAFSSYVPLFQLKTLTGAGGTVCNMSGADKTSETFSFQGRIFMSRM